MLFVQLDANWPDHPKLIEAGLAGAGLHAAALCIAKRLETDGWLPRALLHRQGAGDDLIDRLVALELLDVDGSRVRPHGWLARNPSTADIAVLRAIKADAGKKANHTRWKHPGSFENCETCQPSSDSDPSRTPVGSDVGLVSDPSSDPTGSPYPEGAVEGDASPEPGASAPIDPDSPTILAVAESLVDRQSARYEVVGHLEELNGKHGHDRVDAAVRTIALTGARFDWPSELKTALKAELRATRPPVAAVANRQPSTHVEAVFEEQAPYQGMAYETVRLATG